MPTRAADIAVGVDMGATLAKLAFEDFSRATGDHRPPANLEILSSADPAAVAARVEALAPAHVGLTGGGAAELGALLSFDVARVNEFAAWGAGAKRLLSESHPAETGRYLLVSVGTGTSILLVDGMSVTRVGGTAIGGGTLVGLGRVLTGAEDFGAFCELASKGSRGEVDLLVSDIYRAGEIPLMGALTASSFAKLARPDLAGAPERDDLAAGLVGLVGENVAIICSGLASANQVQRIVYAGSTLRDNACLANVLMGITRLHGRDPMLLAGGEFAGALGSLELARPS